MTFCSVFDMRSPFTDTKPCAQTVRGNAIPALRGTYFYTDYCFAWIRTFRWVGGISTDQREYDLLDPSSLPTSFGEDADGELYVTTAVGDVFKIVAQ